MGSRPAHSTGRKTKRPSQQAPAAPTVATSKPPVSVSKLCDDFSAGWCMVEVAMHSLDGKEIGHAEGVVLQRALKILWPISEYLSDLEAALPMDEEPARP